MNAFDDPLGCCRALRGTWRTLVRVWMARPSFPWGRGLMFDGDLAGGQDKP